jgi:hypothetical protein
MSSRLVRSPSGRVISVEVTTPVPGLEVGHRFTVLGNEIHGQTFGFTGETTGRPPLPDELAARRSAQVRRDRSNVWTDEHRADARRLYAEGGLSQAQIAERVCGDRRYRTTVAVWLRQPDAVAA